MCHSVDERFISPAVAKVLGPFFSKVVPIVYPIIAEAFIAQIELSMEVIDRTTPKLSGDHAVAFRELRKELNVSPIVEKLPTKKMEVWLHKIDEVLKVAGHLEDVAGLVSKLKEFIEGTIKPTVYTIYPLS